MSKWHTIRLMHVMECKREWAGMDAYKVFWYRPDKPAIAAGGATRFNSLDPLTHLYSYW